MEGFKIKNEFKLAGKYVTFVPTEKEFPLNFDGGANVGTIDMNYLKYNFKIETFYDGTEYCEYVINTEEKLKLFTNAYRLYYVANYKGQQFGAGIASSDPKVLLFSNTLSKPNIEGFENFSKGEWGKEVDISEVEIIPIIEPIDLSKHLRKK